MNKITQVIENKLKKTPSEAQATIILNGEKRSIAKHWTLADLIHSLQLDAKKVAIAKGLELIPRSELDSTTLQENDEIEIFHAIGGG